MATADEIAQQFPFLAFLANDPEIGPLLNQALDINTGFSPEKFRAEMMKTNWWRDRSEATREWEIKKATDPSAAHAERETFAAQLNKTTRGFYGTDLPAHKQLWLSEWAMGQGLSPDDPRVIDALLADPVGADYNASIIQGTGQLGVIAHEMQNLAMGKWFTEISLQNALDMAKNVARGTDSLESINARYESQAAAWFPHLADRIKAGESLGDIAAPYRQLIANELELGSPDEVRMNSGSEWQEVLNYRDPNANGQPRVMTQQEVISKARNRPQWWKETHNGRKTDATMAQTMLSAFGFRG